MDTTCYPLVTINGYCNICIAINYKLYILKTSDHYCKFCEKYYNTNPEIYLHIAINAPIAPVLLKFFHFIIKSV
jgi:hypothetical protein